MLAVGAFEAKNRLSELLDRVERGEEVTITRRGRPVARLMRLSRRRDSASALAALQRIVERGKGLSLGGFRIKDLIEEGRR
jgi:prevent-host-death family protein